jgi:hypothetical protein
MDQHFVRLVQRNHLRKSATISSGRVRGIAAASLKETVMIKPSRRFPGEISVARKLCPSSKFLEIRAILQ